MQFLWKYIDELVGKGLEWYVITELLFYATANLVPMALPLAVLLSSIMTFGNMGEHNELVAAKSAGISLQRIMLPLFIFAIMTGCGAFFFANSVWPVANLKFASLLYDIRQKKPAIDIKPGVFYKGIEGFAIRVGSKSKDGIMLYDVTIYDHTAKQGGNIVIKAESGKMQMSDDERYLIITLYKGGTYNEVRKQDEKKNSKSTEYFPLFRNKFDRQVLRMDLEGFKLERTKEDIFKTNYQMLNLSQLAYAADSTLKYNAKKLNDFKTEFNRKFVQYRDTIPVNTTVADTALARPMAYYNSLDKKKQTIVLNTATSIIRANKTYAKIKANEMKHRVVYVRKYFIEWHRKFVIGVSCVVLFLIGAPLGAIIRKGGLGLPVVISVIGFLVMYILNIIGEKMVKQGELLPVQGMWLSIMVLAPIGLFLTYKATTDSAIMETNTYVQILRKFTDLVRKKQKKIAEDIS